MACEREGIDHVLTNPMSQEPLLTAAHRSRTTLTLAASTARWVTTPRKTTLRELCGTYGIGDSVDGAMTLSFMFQGRQHLPGSDQRGQPHVQRGGQCERAWPHHRRNHLRWPSRARWYPTHPPHAGRLLAPFVAFCRACRLLTLHLILGHGHGHVMDYGSLIWVTLQANGGCVVGGKHVSCGGVRSVPRLPGRPSV